MSDLWRDNSNMMWQGYNGNIPSPEFGAQYSWQEYYYNDYFNQMLRIMGLQ